MRRLDYLGLLGIAMPSLVNGGGSLQEQVHADQIRETVTTGRVVSINTQTFDRTLIYEN